MNTMNVKPYDLLVSLDECANADMPLKQIMGLQSIDYLGISFKTKIKRPRLIIKALRKTMKKSDKDAACVIFNNITIGKYKERVNELYKLWSCGKLKIDQSLIYSQNLACNL